MNTSNVQTGLLVGIFALLLVLAFRSPVGRYEFVSHSILTVLRLDTKTGKVVLCERSGLVLAQYSCGNEPLELPAHFGSQ